LSEFRVIVIGAGIGGLAAAAELAASGCAVNVLERAPTPGGKMRAIESAAGPIDAGPTVLTLRGVFDALFAAAGGDFAGAVKLSPLDTLARHAWDSGPMLDLFADRARSADAIGTFAGAGAARGYLEFCARTRRVFEALDTPFMRAPLPTPWGLTRDLGLSGVAGLLAGSPFASLWGVLGKHFVDPRLRQLFARYATYVGASPFACPATLMLIAHVEQEGVWSVEGGMHALARAVADLAVARGASFVYGADAARIETSGDAVTGVTLRDGRRFAADAIVFNGDAAALSAGKLGPAAQRAVPAIHRRQRSLSALVWALSARTGRFPFRRHNVFFSRDYRAEFTDIFKHGRPPCEPTVYVCAQDRADADIHPGAPERFLVLANAPADGDGPVGDPQTNPRARAAVEEVLSRCSASIDLTTPGAVLTTPRDFERLFPATGGALYGQASHGWMASFNRPGTATRLAGLFLAGGSAHPGAGVPMATLSGRLAASAVLARRASISKFRATATRGGMPMAGARTGVTASR
jgi:1-hydroxycarotenoid 3,4-desaturase